jgi:hypothetical protein
MSQSTPPQVPDFFSFTKNELKTHLLTYGVSASKDMSKDSLAYEVKKHYITETLPGQIKNHPGYLNYQGINYRYYNKNKHGFIFKCTRYLLPGNTWTNRKVVRTAYRQLDIQPRFINCPGTLFIELTSAGTLSYPQLPPPYHTCGCLNSIQTIDLGYQDSRPALEMISPSIKFVDVITPEKRLAVIEALSTRRIKWDGLTGGKFGRKSLRKFVLNLNAQPTVNSLVERVMSPLVEIVRAKYPTLLSVKYGAIKSLPGCPSQYEGHCHRLHSDYNKVYSDIPSNQRPVSIILALDEFKFIYLPHLTLARKDMITLQVPPGHGIIFTNNCLHSGGENDSGETKYRLFAYMASESVHIPHNHVTKFEWSSDDENATISFATETGGETEDQTMEEENDDIDNSHDVGDKKVSSASV